MMSTTQEGKWVLVYNVSSFIWVEVICHKNQTFILNSARYYPFEQKI